MHLCVERRGVFNYDMEMLTLLFSQFLLLAVLAFPVLQAFSKRKEATRAAAIFAPLSLILVFFVTLSQGLSASVAVLWICAVFVFLCNIPQLVRFIYGLTFDSTAASYAAAVLQLLLLIAASAFCFLFRPEPAQVSVIQERLVFTRSPSGVFYEKNHFSEPENAVLTLYYPEVTTGETPLLLYLPDMYASSADCSATAAVLAEEGFMVVLADFNRATSVFSLPPALVRPFLFRMQDYFLLKRFTRKKTDYVEEKKLELEQFYSLLTDPGALSVFQNCKLYLVAEGNVKSLAENLKERYSENIADVYFINTARRPIEGYVNGLGNLAVFHPFEALLRGVSRVDGWKQARSIAQAVEEEWNESN